jgi:hypothetical protein
MPPKKAAKKHTPKDGHPSKDLRRAYEHLGRVEVLQRAAGPPGGKVEKLVRLAQEESSEGDPRNVADLLRAAEHLSFAALVDKSDKGGSISGLLEAAVTEEFEHLRGRAEEHWDQEDADPALAEIYQDAMRQAGRAANKGRHREAMELARAAEAIAHVKREHGPKKPSAGGKLRELAAS